VTIGLNVYVLGDELNFAFDYELFVGDETTHTGYAQLQVGF
jgi:hypothetical protein